MSLGVVLVAASGQAQWLDRPTPGIPRTGDGKPDLSAPAPQIQGRPDLTGIWHPDSGQRGIQGIGVTVLSPYFRDVTADLASTAGLFEPWAEAEYKRRVARQGQDDPTARCKPSGIPNLNTYPLPFKIVQTPALVIILYENNTDFRQIFLDGRPHPPDPTPTWMGYSIGRWEGDVLVVDTMGFNDQSWLDRSGHPHSEAMRVIERFRRVDTGRLDIEITINDAKTYRQPITFVQSQRLLPDTELMEHFCTENEKSSEHFR